MTIPTLETERLLLRAHRPDDHPAAVALWADPLVVRYTLGEPSSPSRTWSRMLGYRGLWEWLRYGYWAIEERATGRFVGEVGFADFKRGLGLGMDGVPECGWALAPIVHGRGYATEAVAAACAWSDEAGRHPRTTCLVDPANVASLRVAAKCGFREFARSATPEGAIFFERASAIMVSSTGPD